MNLLFKAKTVKPGYNRIVSPKNAPLKYLEFGRIYARQGDSVERRSGTDEQVWSILSGVASVDISGKTFDTVSGDGLGARADVFSGRPNMIYVPRGATCTIRAESPELHVAVFSAASRRDTAPVLLRPDDIIEAHPGAGNWQRHVYTGVGPNVDADRLLVGETFNKPGCWSSFPPHKHDEDRPPKEAWYEEVYFFLLKPTQGFGIQRVYTAPHTRPKLDECYVLHNGDTVAFPAGYHPVAAAPGYQLYYYWGLAGEQRQYAAWSDDPDHAWLRAVEPIIGAD